LQLHETLFDMLPAEQFLTITEFAPHEHGAQAVSSP
jgi:hypothetical protein